MSEREQRIDRYGKKWVRSAETAGRWYPVLELTCGLVDGIEISGPAEMLGYDEPEFPA